MRTFLFRKKYTVVFKILAFLCCILGTDPDGGRIGYSISGPIFSVDRDTGVVRLRQELDREKQNTLEVIISITGELVSNANIQRNFFFPPSFIMSMG